MVATLEQGIPLDACIDEDHIELLLLLSRESHVWTLTMQTGTGLDAMHPAHTFVVPPKPWQTDSDCMCLVRRTSQQEPSIWGQLLYKFC